MKDYDTIDEERVRGSLDLARLELAAPRWSKGVIDRTVDFVKRNMGSIAWLEGGRRRRKKAFPLDAVREAVVNAVAHRDYGREGTDIEVSLYDDRLEVISPGRLPNGVTVEKMREGVVRVQRATSCSRKSFGTTATSSTTAWVSATVSSSPCDATAGRSPISIEEDDRFIVRLWKEQVNSAAEVKKSLGLDD